ncbi:MAG: DUF5689 domain-containing protein [Bacteroidales bacterium]|jgi:hypothetical protein|nr:DUF5689 domain-containing protein [Bacteroidales bacterium]
MNIKQIMTIILVAFIVAGCVRTNFDPVPDYSDAQYNLPPNAKLVSIEELKGAFPDENNNKMDTITQYMEINVHYDTLPDSSVVRRVDTVMKDYYIYVIVTANDHNGNIYKNLFVRDASGLGRIDGYPASMNISIDKTGIYNFLPVGQKFYIRLTGLILGLYNGLPQIGYVYQRNAGTFPTIGRIPDDIFMTRVYKDDIPNNPKDSLLLKPTEIWESSDFSDGPRGSMLNQLVVLKNVKFSNRDVGQPMCPKPPVGSNPISTDRSLSLQLSPSTPLILRNSSAWKYTTTLVPDSVGDIVCIYTVYNTTYQFYVRELTDFRGFKWDAKPWTTIYEESFSSGLGAWTAQNVSGAQVWSYSSQYGCAMMSGYSGSSNANEDWLISPDIDLTGNHESVVVSIDNALNYLRTQNIDQAISLMVSTNYTGGLPNTATWTRIPWVAKPTGTDFTWINSGSMDVSDYIGSPRVRFALKYVSDASNSSTWEAKNFSVSGRKKGE